MTVRPKPDPEGSAMPGTEAPERASEPLDDEALGALVRDVAGGWTMPPQRIGARTWRDRVQERDADRGRRDWRRRLATAAGLAVAATVLLAFGAIWLNGQGRLPATGSDASASPAATPSSGSPSASGTASPTAPIASPAPTLALVGDPLPVSSLLLDAAGHRVLDLTTGRLGAALERDPEAGGRFILRPAGGWTCVCFTLDRPWSQDPTAISVDLVDYDATGAVERSRFLNTYDGAVPDPLVRTYAPAVGLDVSLAVGADRVYVGWVVRTVAGWQSGVDVVDVVAGQVVQKVHLPGLPLEQGSDATGQPAETVAEPPTVTVAPDGSRLVIAQIRGLLGRNAAGIVSDVGPTLSGHWGAPIEGGDVGVLTDFAGGEGTLDPKWCPWPGDEGFASPEVLVATCSSAGALRRVDPRDGRPLGDVKVDGLQGDLSAVVSAPGGLRYAWFPLSRRLSEVDVVGGRVLRSTTVDGITAMADPGTSDPLSPLAELGRRLGRWIAPPVAAKVYNQPAVALSPDGSRLYLLGVDGEAPTGIAGSTGVHVVDTATLTEVATWPPSADWVSIAVSGDGSLVYLVGAPGMAVDATGAVVEAPERSASLTVLDAASGALQAVAGRLEAQYPLLDPTLVP